MYLHLYDLHLILLTDTSGNHPSHIIISIRIDYTILVNFSILSYLNENNYI